MKIRSLKMNNHKKAFELRTYKDRYEYPYAMLDTQPTDENRIANAYIDPDLGNEAITYELTSGAEDTIHIDRILEYNRDPSYMRDLLLYKLTIEAKKLVESSPVGIRELGRRLGTSPTQIYRLLDEENTRKSLDRVFELLSVLQCRIDIHSINGQASGAKTGKPTLRLTVHG
ncbi:MAG: hypothetical protein QNK16_11370 [Woeseiaceae bacterium]|nr:hypothetical protein [Woeseiaceae bacterium]MDX2608975.1 hypothetical protein [Woeseiaceae bacterium]